MVGKETRNRPLSLFVLVTLWLRSACNIEYWCNRMDGNLTLHYESVSSGKRRQYKMNNEGKAKETANSRDGLDDYIRVSSPGVTAVIVALAVIVAAVIAWGLIGRLPVTETVSGIIADGTKDYAASTGHDLLNQAYGGETKEDGNENILVLCFLDASRFNLDTVQKVGGQAVVETPDHRTFTGRIAKIGNTTPLSRMQAKELLFQNEWLADNCIPGEYSWPVIVKPDEDASAYEFTLAKVTFVTDEIAPIRLLMR